MTEYKVSIIVPVYNVYQYLRRCLNSLVNQTYRNLEIIIVNDCSPDNSKDICLEFLEKDKRIKYVENMENLGISSTRNVGLMNSTGDYIFFIDSDDFIEENTISNMCDCLKEKSYDVVSCDFNYYYDVNTVKRLAVLNTDEYGCELTPIDAYRLLLTQKTNYRCVWAKLIKKSLFENLSFKEGCRYGEDMILVSQLLLKAKSFFHLNKSFYNYSQEGMSLVRSGFNSEKLKEIDILKDWIKIVDDNFPTLRKYAESYLYMVIIDCGIQTYRNGLVNENNELKFYVKSNLSKILFSDLLTFKMKVKAFYVLLR